jgi:ABC-type branched-subunit amino acid transport system permease subunit
MGLLVQESTRFLPQVPGLGELNTLHPQVLLAVRGVVIGLVLILFLRFRPQGLLPERRHVDHTPSDAIPQSA